MISVLNEFRKTLSDMMVQAMHKRVVLYGFGYTGRFLKWYAEYYHSIKVDYVITMDTGFGRAYEAGEFFQASLLDFDYKDALNTVIWLAEPADEKITTILELKGYIKNKTWFDFYHAVYGEDIFWPSADEDVFKRRKTGKRDIQFLEWLEWKYDCNFIQAIDVSDFEVSKDGASYKVLTQKELFPILDKCHCIPTVNDAIFDFGCGKGGAMVSFMDYGFKQAGGVEYEPKIYNVLIDNIKKLGLSNDYTVECIRENAIYIDKELDKYNWFYFFSPFAGKLFFQCINNICRSLKRCKRKVRIIYVGPRCYKYVEESGYFRLTNQFTINTRQRVVDVFESIE